MGRDSDVQDGIRCHVPRQHTARTGVPAGWPVASQQLSLCSLQLKEVQQQHTPLVHHRTDPELVGLQQSFAFLKLALSNRVIMIH